MDKITFLNELELALDDLPREEKIVLCTSMKTYSMKKS